MTNYTIDIELSPETIDALAQNGYALYAMKAVSTTASGGAPLIWYSTPNFTSVMQVTWQDQYAAFVSTSQIIANAEINVTTSVDIDLDQTAYVAQSGGMTVGGGGAAGAVSILNQGNQPWTTGLSQSVDGRSSPVCALPLYGQNLDVITPVEQVLLMFAQNYVNTGTVIYRALSQGLLVDLSAQDTCTVQFDINLGWNALAASATQVMPNEDLVPLLIQS
ncbi:hypothetical protein PMI01_04850 [Caulobacter sp. AP07]|uniref:hypothetical protein n=1 Tax=Caulobacter sp. AP07 TaxID=1144304 RepID=UPI000271EE5F|nr:hypothetical protein [Caulobacter sp. AP07]EJL23348.1 hypothetical protein PMI01_04850 [Caulobacter sp. AP07]